MFVFYFAPYSLGSHNIIEMNDEEHGEFIHGELETYPHEFVIYIAG